MGWAVPSLAGPGQGGPGVTGRPGGQGHPGHGAEGQEDHDEPGQQADVGMALPLPAGTGARDVRTGDVRMGDVKPGHS